MLTNHLQYNQNHDQFFFSGYLEIRLRYEIIITRLDVLFYPHTQYAGWKIKLKPLPPPPLSLHWTCNFCISALSAFHRAAMRSPCRCSFPERSAIAHRSKTIHEREWLPASPSPTILMSTCGPLLNCAKLIPTTEMSFTLEPVLKHTGEPLRGIWGVMGLARGCQRRTGGFQQDSIQFFSNPHQ